MAKRQKTQPISTNPNFKGFLNVTLSDFDKQTIKASPFTADDFQSSLDRYTDSGFKLTFSRDTYNDCFQVIGTVADREHGDFGILLAGRGSTCMKALKQWMYIVEQLIGESTWAENMLPPKRLDLDD